MYQFFFRVAYGWIDDIDIEDPKEKPRGYPVIAGLNRQNITNKFQAIRGINSRFTYHLGFISKEFTKRLYFSTS